MTDPVIDSPEALAAAVVQRFLDNADAGLDTDNDDLIDEITTYNRRTGRWPRTRPS